jgi:hypothetical protein
MLLQTLNPRADGFRKKVLYIKNNQVPLVNYVNFSLYILVYEAKEENMGVTPENELTWP